MFNKTTKLMSEEEAIDKKRQIWNLLSSGDGFCQMNEEGNGKYFLTMRIRKELKSEVLEILR